MAGVVEQSHDLPNGRVCVMWSQCGIQFRSNILLRPGSRIPLHSHSYAHMANVRSGKFAMTVTTPDGEVTTQDVQAPDLIEIPALHQHTFELLEGESGEVLCFWPGEA